MTGPEHYREAERLIDIVNNGEVGDTELFIEHVIGLANAHASLARATDPMLAAIAELERVATVAGERAADAQERAEARKAAVHTAGDEHAHDVTWRMLATAADVHAEHAGDLRDRVAQLRGEQS